MKQVFTIIPGSNAPVLLSVGLAVLMVVLAGLFVYLAVSTRNVRFEVSAHALRITGDMFGRSIPISSLDVPGMRVLDLNREAPYRPRWRRMGTGLPGYSAGWFSLRNGEKSLVFITDRSRVVYIPTGEGYSVMVSTQRPEAFMEAIRSAAGSL
ncbi:MAG: hypothetical protein IH969_02230 [Candidatus Krumholzibacteriota bacterium]|nr:hypothetical protein [Candidatus Krumholzibacteriota bacterium]